MISPASYKDIRKDIINDTIADIRESIPATHIEALGEFDYSSLFRLIENIDLQVGAEMMLFVKKKEPISIPYIGVIAINKVKLKYIEAEKDLLIEYGVESYEELDTIQKEEFDNELKNRARLLKIQSGKGYERRLTKNILQNLVKNIEK